eukprot:GHVL01040655.1.p1 GENE.GHVL01040655.1~~GHVL01040655.1.p1  ORF type:complete len:185 (+),score=58.03 GHVL01040655.1:413-967(+)
MKRLKKKCIDLSLVSFCKIISSNYNFDININDLINIFINKYNNVYKNNINIYDNIYKNNNYIIIIKALGILNIKIRNEKNSSIESIHKIIESINIFNELSNSVILDNLNSILLIYVTHPDELYKFLQNLKSSINNDDYNLITLIKILTNVSLVSFEEYNNFKINNNIYNNKRLYLISEDFEFFF